MASRLRIDPLVSHYPHDTAAKFTEVGVWKIEKDCAVGSQYRERLAGEGVTSSSSSAFFNIRNTPQPPSWADVGREVPHPSVRPKPQTVSQQWNLNAQPWKQPESWSIYQEQPVQEHASQPEQQDMFSNIGFWASEERPSNNHKNHRKEQWERRPSPPQNFNQPPQPTEDVFSNVTMWDDSELLKLQKQQKQQQPKPQPQKKIEPMTIDLFAPTPPPTFPALPISGRASVESTSSTSYLSSEIPEETNAWKSLEMMLNQKPSRSPSITTDGTKSPPVGHWLSNLQ